MAGCTNADTNYLSTAVDVGADWFVDFGADGGDALGEFCRGDAIARYSLVVKFFELLELAGL